MQSVEEQSNKMFADRFDMLPGGKTLQKHGIGPAQAEVLYKQYTRRVAWTVSTNTPLRCPFQDRSRVKQLGASWDANTSVWFVPTDVDLLLFVEWLPHEMGKEAARRRGAQPTAATVISELMTHLENGSHNVRTTPLNTAWHPCSSCHLCNTRATYGPVPNGTVQMPPTEPWECPTCKETKDDQFNICACDIAHNRAKVQVIVEVSTITCVQTIDEGDAHTSGKAPCATKPKLAKIASKAPLDWQRRVKDIFEKVDH